MDNKYGNKMKLPDWIRWSKSKGKYVLENVRQYCNHCTKELKEWEIKVCKENWVLPNHNHWCCHTCSEVAHA